MALQVAETTKAKKRPKVLDHLRISRAMDGGHVVEHHFTDFEHPPEAHKFNKKGMSQGGQHIADHLAKHSGIPGFASEHAEEVDDERAEEGAEGDGDE